MMDKALEESVGLLKMQDVDVISGISGYVGMQECGGDWVAWRG